MPDKTQDKKPSLDVNAQINERLSLQRETVTVKRARPAFLAPLGVIGCGILGLALGAVSPSFPPTLAIGNLIFPQGDKVMGYNANATVASSIITIALMFLWMALVNRKRRANHDGVNPYLTAAAIGCAIGAVGINIMAYMIRQNYLPPL